MIILDRLVNNTCCTVCKMQYNDYTKSIHWKLLWFIELYYTIVRIVNNWHDFAFKKKIVSWKVSEILKISKEIEGEDDENEQIKRCNESKIVRIKVTIFKK